MDRQYANLKTLYNRHRRWSAEGSWAGIHDEPRCGYDQMPKGSGVALGMRVDSTVLQVHQHAASASYSPPPHLAIEAAVAAYEHYRRRVRGWRP